MSSRRLLRLEGALVFIAAVTGYAWLGASWGLFAVLLLAPDVFMAGYLAGPRLGALVYNVGHTYAVPIGIGAVALGTSSVLLGAGALIWAAHIGMDRAMGYGLKHPSGFHDTHLSDPSGEPTLTSSSPGGANRVVVRTILIGAALGLSACQTAPSLQEGRWTGALTPMNHPDMATPVSYDVQYAGRSLSIALVGPGGDVLPTRQPRLSGDTLFFAFDEPDEHVSLSCALSEAAIGYAGRCTAPDGKWARFTMVRPEQP